MRERDADLDGFQTLLTGFADVHPSHAAPAAQDQSRTFAELLREFTHKSAAREEPPDGNAALLRDFGEVWRSAQATDAQAAISLAEDGGRLLDDFDAAWDAWFREQSQRADEFNILGVFGLHDNEIRHSMALQWLLCSDLRRGGTHAQGALGFRLFLEEVGLPSAYATFPYRVSREVAGESARIDLEIASRGHFLIHIENKIGSAEGSDQTPREWIDLQRRANALDVPRNAESAVVGFYLTPDGTTPSAPEFRILRWGQIARIFSRFADLAVPPDVRLFSRHFSSGLQRFVNVEGRRNGESE